MRVGIVSDTHRNREYLNRVADWLVLRQNVNLLYHLGDDYEDVVDLVHKDTEIVQVPGTYHPKYLDGTLKPKQIENILGLRIMLVHSYEKDVTYADRRVVDVILYGHTHKAEIKLDDGLLLMNPGHLKSHIDKQLKPSFGILDVQDKSVSAKIFGMDFKEVKGVNLIRSESGLYRS